MAFAGLLGCWCFDRRQVWAGLQLLWLQMCGLHLTWQLSRVLSLINLHKHERVLANSVAHQKSKSCNEQFKCNNRPIWIPWVLHTGHTPENFNGVETCETTPEKVKYSNNTNDKLTTSQHSFITFADFVCKSPTILIGSKNSHNFCTKNVQTRY